jgi:hypothetical protein
MWTYRQRTGEMVWPDGTVLATGYAGMPPAGKNNPSAQNLHDIGPLPRGLYTMDEPIDTKTHGPYVMWLEPDPSNEMFGRFGFGIHSDSVVHPGAASEGCIVLPIAARKSMWASGDRQLMVVAS